MILGIRTDTLACGWALLDEQARSFVEVGAHAQKMPKGEAITLGGIHRTEALAKVIASKAIGCSAIVVDHAAGELSQISVGLPWGILIGVASMLDPRPRLLTVARERWQRIVMPTADRRSDLASLATAAGAHLLKRHPRALATLERTATRHKEHAIDAALIAMCGAFHAGLCDPIAEPTAA